MACELRSKQASKEAEVFAQYKADRKANFRTAHKAALHEVRERVRLEQCHRSYRSSEPPAAPAPPQKADEEVQRPMRERLRERLREMELRRQRRQSHFTSGRYRRFYRTPCIPGRYRHSWRGAYYWHHAQSPANSDTHSTLPLANVDSQRAVLPLSERDDDLSDIDEARVSLHLRGSGDSINPSPTQDLSVRRSERGNKVPHYAMAIAPYALLCYGHRPIRPTMLWPSPHTPCYAATIAPYAYYATTIALYALVCL